MSLFHYSFAITDIERARRFFVDKLGCSEGRSSDRWIDFNLFGHQLSAHLGTPVGATPHGQVDGTMVPIPHFGCILAWSEFWEFAQRLEAKDVDFVIRPAIRFARKRGEQATMFFMDPDGNALEFKSYRNPTEVFAV